MPAKIEIPNLSDLIALYRAGSSVDEIVKKTGISRKAIYGRFHEASVDFRNPGRPEYIFGRREGAYLRKRYRAGVSLKEISDETGIQRSILDKHFRLHGIKMRGMSEAETIKWKQIKRGGRAAVSRQCGAAWKATLGRKHTDAERLARAATNGARLRHIGFSENEVSASLRGLGLQVSQQTPVGTYNVDITVDIPRIAVEIFSAWRNGQPSHSPHRIEYLLNMGWTVILVITDIRRRGAPAILEIAQKIHALAKILSGNKPERCQYGVIDGKAQPITPRGYYLNGRSRIEGF